MPSQQHIQTTCHPPGVRILCLRVLGEQGISISDLLPTFASPPLSEAELSPCFIISVNQQTIVKRLFWARPREYQDS